MCGKVYIDGYLTLLNMPEDYRKDKENLLAKAEDIQRKEIGILEEKLSKLDLNGQKVFMEGYIEGALHCSYARDTQEDASNGEMCYIYLTSSLQGDSIYTDFLIKQLRRLDMDEVADGIEKAINGYDECDKLLNQLAEAKAANSE